VWDIFRIIGARRAARIFSVFCLCFFVIPLVIWAFGASFDLHSNGVAGKATIFFRAGLGVWVFANFLLLSASFWEFDRNLRNRRAAVYGLLAFGALCVPIIGAVCALGGYFLLRSIKKDL